MRRRNVIIFAHKNETKTDVIHEVQNSISRAEYTV